MSRDENLKPEGIFEPESQVGLVDYIDEFIGALRKQLHSDFLRWGNTWRNRPKEGQELRTKARFTDYFDMFEQAGTPVPWLKIVGGALICWIRDSHPELYIDSDVWAAELAGVEEPALKGVKVSEKGVEDIRVEHHQRSITEIINTPLGELTVEEGERLQKWACEAIHGDSDIMEKLIEEKKSTKEETLNLPRPNLTAHVVGEELKNWEIGVLAYSPANEKGGMVILDSIVFVLGKKDQSLKDAILLGTCDSDGTVMPALLNLGFEGHVTSSGVYQITKIRGFNLADDVLYVSYDYEYTLVEE